MGKILFALQIKHNFYSSEFYIFFPAQIQSNQSFKTRFLFINWDSFYILINSFCFLLFLIRFNSKFLEREWEWGNSKRFFVFIQENYENLYLIWSYQFSVTFFFEYQMTETLNEWNFLKIAHFNSFVISSANFFASSETSKFKNRTVKRC